MSDTTPSKSRRYLTSRQPASGEGRRLIIAIGGAGRSIAMRLPNTLKDSILYTDTDHNNTLRQTLHIGQSTCKGLPARTPQRGIRAATESLEEIEDHLSGVTSLTLIGGLGGGTGSGVLPVIYDLASSIGITTHIAVTLPLRIEEGRRQIAELVDSQIRRKCDDLFVVDIDMIKFGTESIPILKDAFVKANTEVSEMITQHYRLS